MTIRPVAFSTDLFAPMLNEALAGDGPFLQRLRDEWESGALRFDRDGETHRLVLRERALNCPGGS